MKTVLLDLFTSKKFLAALTAVIVYVAGRFGFDVDAATLDRIYGAFLVYVGAQAIADTGKSAARIHAEAESSPLQPLDTPRARDPQAGRVSLALVALIAFAGGGLLLTSSCATAPNAAVIAAIPGAAKQAVVACGKEAEAPAKELLQELGTQAIAQLLRLGRIDWDALEERAWAQGLVTGGCAYTEFTRAIAAAAASSEVSARTLVAEVDPALASLERFRARAGGVRWSTEEP
jgi:hypothetical protein